MIRHLVARLPERLGTSAYQEGWLATLTGGSAEDAQWIACQLNRLTVSVNPPMPAPAPCRRGVEWLAFPGEGAVLLVFIPLPEGASLAALQVLAQFCEPPFFQRLWVEQQVDYMVSCHYQRVADRDGLLVAFQSPERRPGELLHYCRTFLRQLNLMDEAAFGLLQRWLAAQVRSRVPPKVHALDAPRQEHNLPGVTPQAAGVLRIEKMVAL